MTTKLKYEIVVVNNIEVMADVSMLQKSDELYFNATEMSKQFGKLPADFLRLNSTKEYINEVLNDSGYGISHSENLIRVTNGGKYKGTWLHQELAYEFAGWLSAIFRRNLHKWAENRVKDEHQRQQRRLELKTGFLPLINAIQAAHPELKPYHFSNECDLINCLVTGMTAKQFKQIRVIDNVRDGLTIAELNLMDKLQMYSASLIDLGFSYDERKHLLSEQVLKLSGNIKAVA
ncbi:KilA-N domain-containing protein [Methylobacter psychrophilus]|uniref:KilA-N domain-containing protein n=1 Tax=Methylobacter psychrophilus TaxID=96941 RepID=UPI0021D500FF|nr:KilA-N domain-containing protein [Methylobacter psychrophilus]